MNLTTTQKGRLAEIAFEAECIRRGITVSRPTSDARYDYIVDLAGDLKRVQVKWADGKSAKSSGVVVAALSQMTKKRSNQPQQRTLYAADQIDLMILYIPKIDRLVALTPEMFRGIANIYIRLDAPKNGQKKGLRLARDLLW